MHRRRDNRVRGRVSNSVVFIAGRPDPTAPGGSSARRSCLLLTAAATAGAQYPDSAKYTRMDTMIVMRDGVRLHTTVYTPRA